MVTYRVIASDYFSSSTEINNVLLINNPITNQAQLDAVFDDPYYGLNNPNNYDRWNVL
jgi:hypothetical protein